MLHVLLGRFIRHAYGAWALITVQMLFGPFGAEPPHPGGQVLEVHTLGCEACRILVLKLHRRAGHSSGMLVLGDMLPDTGQQRPDAARLALHAAYPVFAAGAVCLR